jgi:hypothetical protein
MNYRAFLSLIILLAFCASVPRAQIFSDPPDSVPFGYGNEGPLQQKCRTCQITLFDNEVVKGRLLRVMGHTLEIDTVSKNRKSPFKSGAFTYQARAIAMDDISSIKCGDPVWDGALKGFLAVGLPVALFTAGVAGAMREPGYDYEDDRIMKAAGLGLVIGGTIGALAGYAVDASIGGREEEIDKNDLKEEWMGYR